MAFLQIPAFLLALVSTTPMLATAATVERGSWTEVANIQASQQIRVTEMNGAQRKGKFAGLTEDALLLSVGKDRIRIEKKDVRRVEVKSEGRRTRNLLIGAAIGLGLGLVTDATAGAYLRNEAGESGGTRAATVALPAAVLGGIGAALPPYRTIYLAPRR